MDGESPSNTEDELVAAAWTAREGSLCTYSHFAVGAVFEDPSGALWSGANVENASYNLGLCAERVALYYALTHGGAGFSRVAIVADAATPVTPCGACRQALLEFAPDATVILENRAGERIRYSVRELLPRAFEARHLP